MDFLKSSNTGQLGQGINYLLANRILNYNYIVSFEGFVSSNIKRTARPIHGPYTSSKNYLKNNIKDKTDNKSPDFIMQKGIFQNVSILESKSTTSDSIRGELKKGFKQCTAGEEILFKKGFKIDNTYVSTVKLKKESENKSSQIYLIDPSNKGVNEELSLELIRFHYASWFAVIEDNENANRLLENKPVVDGIKPIEEILINNQKFLIYEFQGNKGFKVGIHSQILHILRQNDKDFKKEFIEYQSNQFSEKEKLAFRNEGIEIFNDDTLVLDTFSRFPD